MNSRREPLDAEERALAEGLARLSAGGPSPALDASVLAAARDAVGAPPLHPKASRPETPRAHGAHRRPRAKRRWPVAAGAVATLALAVGLAWQLRPTPNSDEFYRASEAPASAGSGPSAAAADAMSVEVPQAVVEANPGGAPPQAGLPADDAAEQAQAASAKARDTVTEEAAASADEAEAFPERARQSRAAPAALPPAPEEPPIVFDAPAPLAPAPANAPMPAMSPPAPPPPPPAPAAVARSQADNGVRATGSAREAKAINGAARGETRQLEAGAARQRVDSSSADAAADADHSDGFGAEINDEPPATADSPTVQRAWLQRIRDLVAAGNPDAARVSLAEFKRRYPGYALPEDLRGLANGQP